MISSSFQNHCSMLLLSHVSVRSRFAQETKDGERTQRLKVINIQDLQLAPTHRYHPTQMTGLSSGLWLLRLSFHESHCPQHAIPRCLGQAHGHSPHCPRNQRDKEGHLLQSNFSWKMYYCILGARIEKFIGYLISHGRPVTCIRPHVRNNIQSINATIGPTLEA